MIISHYCKQCRGGIKTKPDLEPLEAGVGQARLTPEKLELMTVLPSGGRSCREGEASTYNVKPEGKRRNKKRKNGGENQPHCMHAPNQDMQKCEQEWL